MRELEVVVTHCVGLLDVCCERQKWCAKSVKLLRTRPEPPQLPGHICKIAHTDRESHRRHRACTLDVDFTDAGRRPVYSTMYICMHTAQQVYFLNKKKRFLLE